MTNSWMHLTSQAPEYALPEVFAERDPFRARDCGWVEQMRPLIREFTRPSGRVLDPYCGFGSTLIAAGLEGRDSVGIEIEEGRHTLSCERLKALGMRQAQVLLGDCEMLAPGLMSVDLVLTSLPYFGCGFESHHDGQLYLAGTYGGYLEKIRTGLLALKKVIKPGGYLVVAVENIRIGNQFFPQAWDVARLIMARFSFIEERIIVYDKPDNKSSYPLSNRAHEYVLIARNANSGCDLEVSLEVLRELQNTFPRALLIGSFARWLAGSSVRPSDVDLLLPDDDKLVIQLVRWLEMRAFQVTRWGVPVTSSMADLAGDRAHYFRAERADSQGRRVVIDVNFSPGANFYSKHERLAQSIKDFLCVPEKVDLG